MENGAENGNLLSSWKEIGAYLKCTVRSAIRWEKERGLPVHRSKEAPGTRVYAFKAELDDWLRQQALRPAAPSESRPVARSTRKALLIAIPVLALGVAAVLLLRKGDRGPDGPPHDSFSIITSQSQGTGKLRIWEPENAAGYRTTWEVSTSPKNTVMHTTIAAGDIDGDGRPELACPTAFRRTYYKGEEKSLYYCIFVNFYKDGVEGIWKTTFYSESDFLWEVSDYKRNEILVENIDANPAAEIVLKTATVLGVFRYDAAAGEIKLTDNLIGFLKDKRLLLRSVTTVPGRTPGTKALVVSANETDPASGLPEPGSGWILFVERGETGLEVVKSIPVDAGLQDFSLRAGDLSGRGEWGVYTTAVRRAGEANQSYVLGWDLEGRKTIDVAIPGETGDTPLGAMLAIKDISFEPGEDILVCAWPKRLLLYSLEDGGLKLKADQELETPGAFVNSIGFGDLDKDKYLDIVVGGGITPAEGSDTPYFLEVLGYRTSVSDFFSKWKTSGGEKGERAISWLIVSRRST
jgi:hypothetical protein